ncbi:hypothetical protein [Streptomyces fagopyri]|uniref:hypothetical protein n=1 Tax=Streptomyces fagopyri TaxID=2662397 RepID=UPI003801534D
MAPYDYNRDADPDVTDVETWWDYWQIDGRGCEFAVVAGFQGDSRLIRGAETLSGAPRNTPPSLCDGGPRALLDFETPRAQAATKAHQAFEAWNAFASAYPPARPAGDFWARHFTDPEGYPSAMVIEDFRTQPVIEALGERPDLEELVGGDPAARFANDLETLISDAVDEVLPTHALLTLDGRWLSVAGREGRRYFNDYLDRLPRDALVVRVLYHG